MSALAQAKQPAAVEPQWLQKATPEFLLVKEEIVSYLGWLCHLLDDFEIGTFVEEFTDDGHYRLIPRENYVLNSPVCIIDDTKKRLRYRRDLILKHWHYEKFRENRSLGNILVRLTGDNAAETRATFVIYHTDEEGRTSLHLTGALQDKLIKQGGRWRIQDRLAILDTFMPQHAIVVPP
jgi:3-phenylpropionate/cinnamic acid dioxygenase small subunit